MIKAPKSIRDPMQLELYAGSVIATSQENEAVAKIATPFGIGVGRGKFQAGIIASPSDSSLLVMCQRGLTGVQESANSPGELVVDEGKSVSIFKKDGVFNRREPDLSQQNHLSQVANNMGHYQFSEVQYPPIGYLPKAITGLGFMVFFYGSAIGILDYVNHI